MEPKKISFGFNKLIKKTNIISSNVQQEKKKFELIDCLEGQSIKIKDAVEIKEKPLIIPIKDNEKNLLHRIIEAKKQSKKTEKVENDEDNRLDSELTVDELAARHLLREAKARLENKKSDTSKVAVLPLNQDQASLKGEKESTLEDYESIPINDYGLALLRGMGWEKGMAIGKNVSKIVPVQIPELKPKGLGLGATKQIQAEIPSKKAVDKDGKELSLVKNAFAKIIGGTHKGNYCEVQGFDEEAGRVIIKMCSKADIVNVNEFMLVPVSKEEFSKGSKVLNNAKYEEYKEISVKNIKTQRPEQRNIKEERNESSDKESKNTSYHRKYDNSHDSSFKKKSKDNKNRHKSDLSESDSEPKTSKSRHRHRSHSRDKRKNNRSRDRSDSLSDIEYYKKDKKNSKHTKSKYKDHSPSSQSKDRYRKNKNKQRHAHHSSDSDHNTRKNSRHRRDNSSSSEDRRKQRSKKQ